jgi:hypothetical protein
MAVGLFRPATTSESVNPAGTVAAHAILTLLDANTEVTIKRTTRETVRPERFESADLIQTSTVKG